MLLCGWTMLQQVRLHDLDYFYKYLPKKDDWTIYVTLCIINRILCRFDSFSFSFYFSATINRLQIPFVDYVINRKVKIHSKAEPIPLPSPSLCFSFTSYVVCSAFRWSKRLSNLWYKTMVAMTSFLYLFMYWGGEWNGEQWRNDTW